MLAGELVTLRGIERDDLEVLHGWDQEYSTWPENSTHPYSPTSLADALVAYDAREKSPFRAGDTSVPFAVVVDGGVVGRVVLWGIDSHNRLGHLGISLGAEHRGRGYGTDACRVLLRYAFVDRGLHRVQLEVLASNTGAIRAYEKAGFVVDGVLRESGWVRGRFEDEVIMSVLAPDVQP